MKYSTYQMDNFYKCLASGVVKTSGIMNYIQHLFIAEQCNNYKRILEVCCGRGLILPLLNNLSENLIDYTGVDISNENLIEARETKEVILQSNNKHKISLIQGNVTILSTFLKNDFFDLVIYTSSIEHMSKQDGELSLIEISKVLKSGGKLFLSTPITIKQIPYKLQYKAHIYEWDYNEIKGALLKLFTVNEEFGLLPVDDDILIENTFKQKYGEGIVLWINNIKNKIPIQFLSTVIAADCPEQSKEVLFICTNN